MSRQTEYAREQLPHEGFTRFAGMLLVFIFAHAMIALGGAFWGGASYWSLLAYGIECAVVLASVALAARTLASRKVVQLLMAGLIALHFVCFAMVRFFWMDLPEALEESVLVARVAFYFASASVGFWLASAVLTDRLREVLYAAALPAGLMWAGSWWLLLETSDANRVVTSLGLPLVMLLLGLLLFELRQNKSLRRVFLNRAPNAVHSELRSAKRVHESMFPKPIDTNGFRFGYAYRPMRQIGGDFIHLHLEDPAEPSNGPFYLTLIDVTGHGITSALTVNRLHAELQQFFATSDRPCPSEALACLNDYIRLTMAEHGLFATGMCIEVDVNSGKVTIANAGHPLCYHRQSSGLEEVQAEGPMLGVFPPEAFDSTPVNLTYEPGDQLVMVTDGAIESRSPAGEPIGNDRLRRIIERSCEQSAAPISDNGDASLLQQRISGRLLDRSDVRKPTGLIQQVLRQRMNAHPCALADEIMLSIDDFVQQDSQDDILIATLELLKASRKTSSEAAEAANLEATAV